MTADAIATYETQAAVEPYGVDEMEEEDQLCKHCGKLILEGHAYELGDDRWHINCFRCSKCSNLLGINSDFLVVGTGELVCENCFYDCQVCGKKIGDLAILAGNQPYCADCFVCKHCKNRIDNLRYAKTSSGLYCMNCHEKVLQKKKRLEQEKRTRRQQKRNSASGNMSGNSSRNTTPIFEKSLPSIPLKDVATTQEVVNNNSSGSGPSIQGFSSPFESEDILLDSKVSPVASVKRQSLSSIVSDPDPDHPLYRKPYVAQDIDSYEQAGKVTSQMAAYSQDHDDSITLGVPPKQKPKQDVLHRTPISSRAANNRKMVFVSDEDIDDNPEPLDDDLILKNQIKRSSDGLKHLSGSNTPKTSKFRFNSSSPSGDVNKIGRSLSIKSPKMLLNRHKRTESDDIINTLDPKIEPSHSRSSSDILNSYVSETSTIRYEELSKLETAIKNKTVELYMINSKVSNLKDEVQTLITTKDSLTKQISELSLIIQKLKYQVETELKKAKKHDLDSYEDHTLLPYKSNSRNTSENSVNDVYYPAVQKKTNPSTVDSSIESLNESKPPLSITSPPGFSVQPYTSAVITPTTDETVTFGESVQEAVKPKVKARFWRSKGFSKFNKENESLKISAPVLQHLDEEAFNQMNNKNKTPTSSSNINKNKMTFLDKFSNSMSNSTSNNNLNGELLNGIKSPVKSATSNITQSTTSSMTLIERATKENRDIPLIILTCVKYVEKNGLHSEGIYRKSGGTSQIQHLEHLFETLSDSDLSNNEELEHSLNQDINVVTSVFKRYLRRLPEPIIIYSLYDQYISCASIKRIDKKIEKIKNIVNQLPKQHRMTLHLISKHLNLISQYSEANFMNLHNLAIVFAPSLVRDLTGEREIADMVHKNDVTEFLVSNYRAIFS